MLQMASNTYPELVRLPIWLLWSSYRCVASCAHMWTTVSLISVTLKSDGVFLQNCIRNKSATRNYRKGILTCSLAAWMYPFGQQNDEEIKIK